MWTNPFPARRPGGSRWRFRSTNVFLGQPFRARVMLPASPENGVEALREVQFNGNGFISDLTTMRQAVETDRINGQSLPAYHL